MKALGHRRNCRHDPGIHCVGRFAPFLTGFPEFVPGSIQRRGDELLHAGTDIRRNWQRLRRLLPRSEGRIFGGRDGRQRRQRRYDECGRRELGEHVRLFMNASLPLSRYRGRAERSPAFPRLGRG